MKITLELPDHAFSSLPQGPTEFAAELRLAAGVKWYELGRISQAKAAEIAGISRAAFIDALRIYRVPAIQAAPVSIPLPGKLPTFKGGAIHANPRQMKQLLYADHE